jgi:TPR repeat protein
VLPERFVKIRHYGLLGNRQRHERLAQARRLLGVSAAPQVEPPSEAKASDPAPQPLRCPYCHQPGLVWAREVPPQTVVPLANYYHLKWGGRRGKEPKAFRWYSISAKRGHPESKKVLETWGS